VEGLRRGNAQEIQALEIFLGCDCGRTIGTETWSRGWEVW